MNMFHNLKLLKYILLFEWQYKLNCILNQQFGNDKCRPVCTTANNFTIHLVLLIIEKAADQIILYTVLYNV
jgi:hypothetical protein